MSDWISVKNKLPSPYIDGNRNDVLVYGGVSEGYSRLYMDVWKGYYDNGKWHIVNNGDYVDGGHGQDYDDAEITHWQPLPEPPRP